MSPAKGLRKRKLEADEGVTRRITRSMTRTPEAVSSSATAPDLAASIDREPSMSPESSPDRISLPEPDIQADTAGSDNGQDLDMYTDDWTDPWGTEDQNQRWTDQWLWGGCSSGIVIDGAWTALTTAVADLKNHLLNGGDTYECLDSSSREVVESFWPHAKEIADHPDGVGLGHVVTAYVWRLLWEQQLSPECADNLKWPTEEWSAFQKLGSRLHPHVNHGNNSLSRCYYQWRSKTARMLFALGDPRPAIQDRIEKLLNSDPVIACRSRARIDAHQAAVNGGAKFDPFVGDPKRGIDERIKNLAHRVADFEFKCTALKYRCELTINDEETGKSFDFPFRTTGEMLDDSLFPVHEDGLPVDIIVQPLFEVYGVRNDATAATSRTLLGETDVEDRDQWVLRSALLVRVRGKPGAATEIECEIEDSGTGLDEELKLEPIQHSLTPSYKDERPKIVRRFLENAR